MQPLIDLYKNSDTLHHAYFFVTEKVKETAEELKDFLRKHLGLETQGNPDVMHHQFKTLAIDDARSLALAQTKKNLGNKQVFIIEADFITEEAQNALLKVFEEPTANTHFFVISPQNMLLPTLKSRVELIHFTPNPSPWQGEGRREWNERRGEVLKMPLEKRLEKVKKITDAIADEEKTKQDAIAFLNDVERELYEGGIEKNSESLKICEQARAALYDRGAPVKMILEHVVLSI